MSQQGPKLVFVVALALLLAIIALPLPTNQAQQASQFGTNWIANFFNNTNLSGNSVATVTYPNGLNFNWPNGPLDANGNPVPGVNTSGYSVRFTTTETFQDGTYRFTVTSEDGVRLTVNNQVVIDQFITRPLGTLTADVALTAGSYPLVVDFFDSQGGAQLRVEWSLVTGQPAQPTATPVPPATASVIQVRGLAVRTGPYLGASLITIARPDNTYNVLAQNDKEGLFTWYLLEIPREDGNNQIGWSSGRYLEVTDTVGNVPFRDSVFETLDNAPSTGVFGVTRSVMNFRIRPSQRTPQLADIPQIAWGEEVEILSRTVQGGRDRWYQVRYLGRVGWIAAPWVRVTRGLLEAVPIY